MMKRVSAVALVIPLVVALVAALHAQGAGSAPVINTAENAAWSVKDVDFGITESNRVFIRYSWTVTIRNGIPRPQTFDLVVQFLDKDDFVIDSVRLSRQGIAAKDERIMTGDAQISLPGALNVATMKAMATRHPVD